MIVGCFIIGAVFLGGSGLFQYLGSESEVVAKVQKLIEENKSTEQKVYIQKQIWTDQGIFVDEPNMLKAKYNSIFFNKLLIGNTYKFKLDGKYIEGTGMYPNVLDVEPEEGSVFGVPETGCDTTDVALEKITRQAEEFYNKGKMHFKRGEYDLAVENYRKAAELLPDNKNINQSLQAAEAKLQ